MRRSGIYGFYGHADTGLRYGLGRRFEILGGGRRSAPGRGFAGGYGRYGGGFGGGYGGYGDVGLGEVSGGYGGQGTYGQAGIYGGQGTYGGGTTATQSGYGGDGFAYRSETPLAARFAEAPLGPSPYAAYSPADSYAYAAAADVGRGHRALDANREGIRDCPCAPRREPVIYRYGVGTAY